MKLFFYKILLYIFLALVFLIILDFFVFPKNTNVMSVKKELLKKEQAPILILGNSHTFFGINPQYLKKKAINLANKSRKIETDYFLLRKYLNKNRSVVILPISYYTLFTKEISSKEKRLYYHFYDLNEYDQGTVENSLIIHEPFQELVNNAFFREVKISKLGWRANKSTYVYDEKTNKERIGDIKERLSRVSVINKNSFYLKKIIELCHKNKSTLILVLPPYHPDFYKLTKNKYGIKIREILGKINLKSSILIDGEKLGITNDLYFENIDHLNDEGAKIFTQSIDSILRLKVN